MRDPYEILELKKGASKDEIKRAYKRLAKQYHPDQYDDNPLKDLAEERMREVNEAYDHLMKNSSDSYQSSSYNSSQNYNNNYSSNNYSNTNNNYSSASSSYSDVRKDINTGNLKAAEQKLQSMTTRDAEWNYLMGLLFLRKGWYDSANNYITTAYNLNPSNPEYRNQYTQLNRQSHQYRQNYYGKRRRGNDDMCDLCVNIWCADTLCECLGGDLIDCL